MTLGLHTVNTANAWLNTIRGGGAGTTFTALAAIYVDLHTADPGAAGTTSRAALAVTTRPAATLGAASSGAVAITGTNPVWTAQAGSNETVSHISVWAAATAGNVHWTAAITTPQLWATGNTFTLTSLGMSLAPLMA